MHVFFTTIMVENILVATKFCMSLASMMFSDIKNSSKYRSVRSDPSGSLLEDPTHNITTLRHQLYTRRTSKFNLVNVCNETYYYYVLCYLSLHPFLFSRLWCIMGGTLLCTHLSFQKCGACIMRGTLILILDAVFATTTSKTTK